MQPTGISARASVGCCDQGDGLGCAGAGPPRAVPTGVLRVRRARVVQSPTDHDEEVTTMTLQLFCCDDGCGCGDDCC